MDWKKRAGAYLVRKKIRTGILFFIMMLITAVVLAVPRCEKVREGFKRSSQELMN